MNDIGIFTVPPPGTPATSFPRWSQLPDEFKVSILGYALVQPYPVRRMTHVYNGFGGFFDVMLKTHNRKLAGLAFETYYKCSSFEFYLDLTDGEKHLVPTSAKAANLMRKVHLTIAIYQRDEIKNLNSEKLYHDFTTRSAENIAEVGGCQYTPVFQDITGRFSTFENLQEFAVTIEGEDDRPSGYQIHG